MGRNSGVTTEEMRHACVGLSACLKGVGCIANGGRFASVKWRWSPVSAQAELITRSNDARWLANTAGSKQSEA
jgi:hypothetical protein